MGEQIPAGCSKPVKPKKNVEHESNNNIIEEKKEKINMIKVGQQAPDFTAPAYHKGKFVEFKLSEHLGKWVLLCFYPGDFTFV